MQKADVCTNIRITQRWATANTSNSNFTKWVCPESREHEGSNKCIESVTERGNLEKADMQEGSSRGWESILKLKFKTQ